MLTVTCRWSQQDYIVKSQTRCRSILLTLTLTLNNLARPLCAKNKLKKKKNFPFSTLAKISKFGDLNSEWKVREEISSTGNSLCDKISAVIMSLNYKKHIEVKLFFSYCIL